jgi:uncharacterized membrane protein
MQALKLLLIALGLLMFSDFIWIGVVAKNLYMKQYAEWLRFENGQLQPIWWAAAIVYLLLASASVFLVKPLANGSLWSACLYGAMMGAVIYGVYDFTCLAIFKNWPVGMAFIDWAWGIVLCGLCGLTTVACSRVIS